MQNCDEASPSISLIGCVQLVKMIIALEHIVYFNQNLLTYTFEHFLTIVMQNGDEALSENSIGSPTIHSGTALQLSPYCTTHRCAL